MRNTWAGLFGKWIVRKHQRLSKLCCRRHRLALHFNTHVSHETMVPLLCTVFLKFSRSRGTAYNFANNPRAFMLTSIKKRALPPFIRAIK